MLWLIIGLLVVTFSFILLYKNGDSNEVGLIFLLGFLISAIGGFLVFCGFNTYPTIQSRISEIKTLKVGIEDIRNANYEDLVSENAIVTGSLSNIKQSTVLSEYISTVISKESDLKRTIIKNQIEEKMWVYKIFGGSLFIDSRIHNINIEEL